MDWHWGAEESLLCQTLQEELPTWNHLTSLKVLWFQITNVEGWPVWIWGSWWFISLHPAPQWRQANFLAAHFSVVALLDSCEPQALGPVPPLLLFHGLRFNTSLRAKWDLVLSYLTGFLFSPHFGSFVMTYFHVNSVIYFKILCII